tara:strand:- start:3328 stop:3885 length:558 start_codon:yes stop_codon:yes gene_type:complete
MKEQMRDKTRDQLQQALNSAHVRAEMSERKSDLEEVDNSWYQRSLGVIEISDSPVKWINILKKDGSQHSPPRWWIVLGIPDDRPISTSRETKIKTIRKKSFPLFGKVVDVTWKGDDGGTDLIHILSNDVSTKALASRIGNLEIKSQANGFQGWMLVIDRRFRPTTEDWDAIETIARHLLSSSRTF